MRMGVQPTVTGWGYSEGGTVWFLPEGHFRAGDKGKPVIEVLTA
jgi:hypothetical protein